MVYRADIHTRDKITSVFWEGRMKIWVNVFLISSVQFSSIQSLSCAWVLWPQGLQHARLSVHHQLQELAQIHVHWIDDAIKPSHPLSSPSPLAFNLSQHQGLFQWVSSSYQVVKVLELQLQHQSFKWIFRTDFLKDWLVGSACSSRDSQESSPTPQFKNINPAGLIFIYGPTSHPYMTTGKTTALTRWNFAGKVMSLFINILFRLVTAFLPRSKCLLISWL